MNLAFQVAKEITPIIKNSAVFPVDTGNFRDHGVLAVETGRNQAGIIFGGEVVPYAYKLQFADRTDYGNPNRHKGFLNKIIEREVIPYIERKYNGRRV